jgi:DNA-binding SARP family transcriptional activator/transposase
VSERTVDAKLTMPRIADIVRRSRVLASIERALRTGCCWIAAPAGYGKSTAMADFLQRRSGMHIWYRVDEGDRDLAGFFYDFGATLPRARARRLPKFGPEYAEQPLAFARRWFRAFFAGLPPDTLVVLDDLHYAATPPFHDLLFAMLREMPESARCACLSRELPPPQLEDLRLRRRMHVVDRGTLEFSTSEARALLRGRHCDAAEIEAAHGWAIGLLLLADATARPGAGSAQFSRGDAIVEAIQRQLLDPLPPAERTALLELGLLPQITPELVQACAGATRGRALLARLRERQLLIAQGPSDRHGFRLHDLVRDALQRQLALHLRPAELAQRRTRIANLLARAGQTDEAIELALQANAWPLARRLIAASADTLVDQGRHATLAAWGHRLPDREIDAPLAYWFGVAQMADDAAAEVWFERAWNGHAKNRTMRCLTVARAVLAKTASWRSHLGLSIWTRRARQLARTTLPTLHGDDELLVLTGFLRAFDFAEDAHGSNAVTAAIAARLLARLACVHVDDTASMRLFASEALIEHADIDGNRHLFEQAVDSVAADLRAADLSPWALGLWLVAFGAVSGRCFAYSRRGFPYADAESALRAAIALGERELLRGVEFGALYHLQWQMRLRNEFTQCAGLVARLAAIADSRYTTQVAVIADCEAALHTAAGRSDEAQRACARFMAAIEAADEPPVERWPHFITLFQAQLRAGRLADAIDGLQQRVGAFDGALRQRMQACIAVAQAVAAKQTRDAGWRERLRHAMAAVAAANWPAILLNLPDILADLAADALECGFETDHVRALIAQRRLKPPPRRPAGWPWPLRLRLLGGFSLERHGAALEPGAKAPRRALDLLRLLAISRPHACPLEDLHDALWPDADGAQARAACEQALHRLRKLLGDASLVVQRDGRVSLDRERVWTDLDAWEARRQSLVPDTMLTPDEVRELLLEFGGPLFGAEPAAPWSLVVAERVRAAFVELAERAAGEALAAGDPDRAHALVHHALDVYPDSARLHELLIRQSIGRSDPAGALEAWGRWERMRHALGQPQPPTIAELGEYLSKGSARLRPVSLVSDS